MLCFIIYLLDKTGLAQRSTADHGKCSRSLQGCSMRFIGPGMFSKSRGMIIVALLDGYADQRMQRWQRIRDLPTLAAGRTG